MSLPINVGKAIRLGRIFNKGRTFIVAMDHGLESGPIKGIERIRDSVKKILVDGVNAVMVSFGVSRAIVDIIAGRASLITTIPDDERYVMEAIRIGADAVKTTYFGQIPLTQEKLRRFASVAKECEDFGLPYLIELVPTDQSGKVIYEVQKVMEAARIGAEIGGDFVKIPYTGSIDSFRSVVESCPVPVVIMGGPMIENEKNVLEWVKDSVKAGGAGVAFGRNVWQHRDPSSMSKAIAKVLHSGVEVEEAIKEIRATA